MSNIIENALKPTNGYVLKMTRNTVNGWYELEVGIPNNWVFAENDDIKCEILNEFKTGKLVKISPKTEDIIVDDLYHFVELIIITNEKIAKKEKEFTDKMNEMKNKLESEAKNFYAELDKLKENSFKDLKEHKDSKTIKNSVSNTSNKKRGRQRKDSTTESKIPKDSETITNREPQSTTTK